MLLVKANEATAARRRVDFFLVDATDFATPETGEALGQPQVSADGAAWTDVGISTLTHVGNGRYYADLTQTIVATAGTLIRTRYKSANTAECPGDSVQVVGFNPAAAKHTATLAAADVTGNLPADVLAWNGAAVPAPITAEAAPANFATLGINASGHILTVATLTNAPADSAGITTLLTRATEARLAKLDIGAETLAHTGNAATFKADVSGLLTSVAAVKAKTDQLTFTTPGVVDASGGDGATVEEIVAALGSRPIRITAPVDPDDGDRLTIYQGDDHTAGDRLPTWVRANYAGPDLTGATAVLRLLQIEKYDRRGTSAEAQVETTATLTVVGSTVTITAPLTAAQTDALTSNPPALDDTHWYHVIATTSDGKTVTLAMGPARVVRGVDTPAA